MNQAHRVQVVILGAGLSGLVLATLLDVDDADVTIVEQDLPPGRPGLFHGIVTGSDLTALALKPEDIGGVRIVEVDHHPGGVATALDWHACEHRALLDALRGRLRDRGMRIIANHREVDLIWRDGAVGGVRWRETDEEVHSHLLVLADESDPRLAEQVGLRPDWLPTQIMHLAKERFSAPSGLVGERFGSQGAGLRVIAHRRVSLWGANGRVLLVPGQDAITVKVAVLLEDEMTSARHIREFMDEVKLDFPLDSALAGLTAEAFFTEVVPSAGYDLRSRFHTDGMLVVNDLLGLTHPLNRDGCSTTVDICRLAASVIGNAVEHGDFSAHGLDFWTSGLWKSIVEPVNRRRRADRALRHRPPWEWASLVALTPEMTERPNSAKLVPQTGVMHRLRRLGRRHGSGDPEVSSS